MIVLTLFSGSLVAAAAEAQQSGLSEQERIKQANDAGMTIEHWAAQKADDLGQQDQAAFAGVAFSKGTVIPQVFVIRSGEALAERI